MGAEQSAQQPAIVTRKNIIKGKSSQEQAIQRRYDIYNKSGSALHIAASHGDERQIRQLVRDEADVNDTDMEGRTPFMMACKYGKLQTARLLIKLSANPDLTDKKNRNALDHSTHNHVKEWLTRYLRTRRLSEHGDMEIHNYTAVMQAPSIKSAAPSAPQLQRAATVNTSLSTSFDGARTLSSWKSLLPKSSFSGSRSSVESMSTESSQSKQSGAGSWSKVRESVKSGELARTDSSFDKRPLQRPGSTIREGMKSIKMECGKRLHERTHSDASQTAAEVVHKLSDLDVCLGNDLTMGLRSSLNRTETVVRKGKGRK